MDLTIGCKEVKIETKRYTDYVEVTLEDVDTADLSDEMKDKKEVIEIVAQDHPQEALYYMDEDEIKKFCETYFDWVKDNE